ncbi:MAG: hydantoinase B/oxoprolinase family protein [Candidatus Latescibacteria bacterium]|nr:hydantoinase B/oxoprolinase family protein [Candidatus Latescibacterota bacterium]
MSDSKLDAVSLEVLWNRLISIVNEQAAVLMHASFTTVVREAGDLSAGVFDRAGNMVAQAVTGTPGHINTMANCVRHFVNLHPIDSLKLGDSLLTNDPWLASGHLHDITVVTPVFYKGRGVGWFANTCHAMDIGGRTLGAGAREVFEEGLHIPIMRLFREGEINKDLIDIVRANVRTPDEVVGDLYAQQAGNDVGAKKLIEALKDYGLEDIEGLAKQILDRSEVATREAIAQIPNGIYEDEVEIDGYDTPLVIRAKVTVQDRDLIVDYAGTSDQVGRGINVVYNYTHAYTTYPLKCAISPDIPNNEGSFRPITVVAPEGSILNAQFPCAVGARHLIGHFLAQPLFGALSKAIPNRVIADGSAGLWNTQIEGKDRAGNVFAYIFFSAGGMGARPNDDGISSVAFPSGIRGVPAEAIEAVSPVIMHRRALIQDSGGAGKYRGGLSQEMVLTVDSDTPALHSCMYDRTQFAARGFVGGKEGMPGELFLSDGTQLKPKGRYELHPGQAVTLRLPGGGGFYSALERDPQGVLDDVVQERVSVEAARDLYGVVVDLEVGKVDEQATALLRAKMSNA